MKKLVQEIIEEYGSRDPFEILEKMDAVVIFHPMKIRGFTFRSDDGVPIVCLSDSLNTPENASERVRVAAHELGHVIMHPHLNAHRDAPCAIKEAEYEANLFAELLIGEEARDL